MTTKKIIGNIYLAIAITIFAASNSIVSKLADIGMNNPIDGRNPISFCNVLFVGNLCALLTLIVVYRHQWRANSLQQFSLLNWSILIVVAILAGAIAPSLTFFALEQTTATNVVLISRIQFPLTFAFSVLILQKRINWWMFAGELVSIVGIILMIVLQSPEDNAISMIGVKIGKGVLLAALGAITMSVANIIRRVRLNQIPLGIFTIFRTAVGTLVFWALTVKLFGLEHFRDVFTPVVWQWLSVYGIFIVAGGQLVWFQGVQKNSFQSISYAGYLIPLIGVLAAYVILGEIPTMAQYVGGSTILIGTILNQIGIVRQKQKQKFQKSDMEHFVDFKGV